MSGSESGSDDMPLGAQVIIYLTKDDADVVNVNFRETWLPGHWF